MAYFFEPPPHDFPDRAHRHLLTHPQNLRELVEQAAPAVAPSLAFERARLLTRELPLPDWRKRENDLFFEVPFRTPQSDSPGEVLVGVLVEHQTKPDPAMPLRTLVYATGYWDEQWRAWEKITRSKPPLILAPVLPIVFHAGRDRWTTHRRLADLFDPPEHFRRFLPHWEPVFWHLFEQPPDALLQAAGPWVQAMAVVRQEKADLEQYKQVCADVARRLEVMASQDKTRWHDLMCFLVAWTHHCRKRKELPALDTELEASILNGALREEVKTMTEAGDQTLLEWAEDHYRTKGAVEACRENLRALLEDRFGTLPGALVQRIEASEDLARLKACVRQVPHLKTLDDVPL